MLTADCPALTTPANGSLSGSERIYGSNITVTCHDRFHLNGSEQLVCEENGKWSHVTPNCIGENRFTTLQQLSVIQKPGFAYLEDKEKRFKMWKPLSL